jgi:hypothetical protein
MKTISQNEDRYSQQSGNWVISASKEIKPIYLPIGVSLQNLKPLINADGIVVKVGEDYLCSLKTLNEIRDSKNPHYDIVQNGTLKVKDNEVVIGKTVKIIELDISRLDEIANVQDTKGIKAGVSSVEYIYEGERVDSIPKNLIEQINYTLTPDSVRGIDKYTLYKLKLAPDEAYSIEALTIVKQAEGELLDMAKLKVFSEGIRSRLTLLREDFNMIKSMFFKGTIPNNEGKVELTNYIPDPVTQLLGGKNYHDVIYKEVGAVQRYIDVDGKYRGIASRLVATEDRLSSQTQNIQQQLSQAQSGDIQTQQRLQEQLNQTKQQLEKIQKKVGA